jgi:predicted RNase H-like HicB family nuclease
MLSAMKEITVSVFWDQEAEVWLAESEDLPGLNTWANTREELHRKVQVMIPELMQDDMPHESAIPYHMKDKAVFASA